MQMEPKGARGQEADILEAKFHRLSIANLVPGPHKDIFTRAVRNVLSTDISLMTLAQIVDGLPLSEVEIDNGSTSTRLGVKHPLHEKHQQLCPGVMEKTPELYNDFDVDSLRVSSKVSESNVATFLGSSPTLITIDIASP